MSQAKAETTSRGSRVASALVRAVGVLASLVAVAVVLAHAVLWTDRMPFSSYNVTDTDRFIGFIVSGWALAIAGLIWLVALIIAWWRRPLHTIRLAVPPIVLVVGAAVFVALGTVVPSGFDSSRADLDAVADQARSHHPGWSENYFHSGSPRRVGNLEIDSVSHREDGVVVVSDADSGVFFHMSGWAHSPDGPPTFDPRVRGLEVTHLDGDWYSYGYVL
ncbi:hypothetical protein [uncultured Dietzia sp.]|uniref:hypothetical protein n=1 Tax=uncultured Dietzia sp. TaxID=395519 RepID=UPI0025E643AB|nr:hypothetical protein [uncultured Dietzia sp.]